MERTKFNKDISSVLWVVLFILLSVSALFLASYYVYMMIDTANSSDDELKYKLWDASPTEFRFNSVRDASLSPTMIYFQNSTKGAALLNNESLTIEYYNDLKSYITEGFSDASFEIYRNEEREFIENSILNSPCVYLKFEAQLPFYIFLYYMDGNIPQNVLENEYYLYYVDSFFIVRQNNGEGYYVAAVSDDVIITSGSKTDVLYPTELTDRVVSEAVISENTEFVEAVFTRNSYNEESAPFSVSVTEDIYVSRIISSEKYNIKEYGTAVESVLKLFGYNPDKVSKYSESHSIDVYVETFGLLKLSRDKIVFEASSGEGIDPGEYTMIEGDISLFDIICVCDGFISSVDYATENLMLGGDAIVKLESVTYDDEVLTVSYNYYFDNIPIENSRAADFSFVDGKMTKATVYSTNIEDSLSRDTLSGSGLIVKLYADDNNMKSAYLDLLYRRNGSDLTAEWIIYK